MRKLIEIWLGGSPIVIRLRSSERQPTDSIPDIAAGAHKNRQTVNMLQIGKLKNWKEKYLFNTQRRVNISYSECVGCRDRSQAELKSSYTRLHPPSLSFWYLTEWQPASSHQIRNIVARVWANLHTWISSQIYNFCGEFLMQTASALRIRAVNPRWIGCMRNVDERH